jgi:uroporphyrinogen-III decarboxylase
MDVVQFRREYGNDLLMIGGIDKRAIVQGRSAIDAEIRRISPIIAKGGYVPFPDHEIPLEAEFQNVVYFLEKLEDVILGG